MRRLLLIACSALLALAAGSAGVMAAPAADRIALPDGFQPEGISIKPDGTFYVGSIPTGAVFAGNVKSGTGAVLVDAQEGRSAVGLKARRGLLFVAGGETGQAYVYDADTGSEVATYQLSQAPSFINDVIVTRRAAWFTDSFNPVLYRISLSRDGDPRKTVHTVPFSGDIRYQEGFNANGIEATPGGHKLIVVQSNTGLLFRVDPGTGRTQRIDLDGKRVVNGDGLLLDGRCLYVVQNLDNKIAVVELTHEARAGEVERRVKDADFDVPTTLDDFGSHLYVVNARFTTPPRAQTPYWVAIVHKPGC